MTDDKNKNPIDNILQSGKSSGKINPYELKAKLNIASEIIQAKQRTEKAKENPTSGKGSLTKEEIDELYKRDDNEPYWNR
jgi:hypothetical protein